MAIYNEILAARFSRALQKLFSMKGPQAAKQLSGEIAAMLPMFYGSECRYLEGWQRYALNVVFNASAANLNMVQVRNPAGSNVIAVFEKILMASDQNVSTDQLLVEVGTQTVDFSISNASTRFDARGNQRTSMIVSTRQNASGPGLSLKFLALCPLNSNVECITTDLHEFPVLPGDACAVQNAIVNQPCVFTLWWRERVMEESELT